MKTGRKMQQDERNGNYFVRFMRNGVVRYYNLGTNERKAAKTLRRLERAVAEGRISFDDGSGGETSQRIDDNGRRDMRLEEMAFLHLEWVRANRSAGTFRNRQGFVRRFLDFAGEAMVSDVDEEMLKGFYRHMKEHYSRSDNGGNEAMAAVKAMFRWSLKDKKTKCDLSFDRFPEIIRDPPPTKRIDPEDFRRLLRNSDPALRDILVFGLETGLRPLELRDLTLDQVRHTAEGIAYVHIEKHKTWRTTKQPAPRVVALSPLCEEIIERQMRSHPQSKHIFLNAAGRPYCRFTLRNRLRRLSIKLDIKRITPYGLRHTFASMQSEAGVESTRLANMMGHSSTRTLKRYVSSSVRADQEAMARLDGQVRSMLGRALADELAAKPAVRPPAASGDTPSASHVPAGAEPISN